MFKREYIGSGSLAVKFDGDYVIIENTNGADRICLDAAAYSDLLDYMDRLGVMAEGPETQPQ